MFDQWLKRGLFIILISGVLFYLSFHFGLMQHWLVKNQIYRLSGSERETAEREFYGRDKSKYIFAGTLAKINHHGLGGVWVWTHQGLKYFQADQYTFYWLS